MSIRRGIFFVLAGLLAACGSSPDGPPYSPEDALETLEVPPGFRVEIAASEPQITDPVDMAFDADGRLYVVEMPDYPAEGESGATSRVKLLVDTDDDRRYDTTYVYADSLPFANGVMPWKDGILVTSAPDIIYFEDTDDDGHADIRRVVLTGFAATNPQLRMSALEYGIDNWIYGAYSIAGGDRRFPQFSDRGHPLTFPDNPVRDSVDIRPGTDFRFRPERFEVEPAGGMSQFGNAFDADGNRFAVWNNRHLRHVVLPHKYAVRNPYLHLPSVMESIPEHGGAATLYPITENPLHLHESEIGHFTSACGHSIYTADKFPDDYRGNAFVCAPVHNVVHTDRLRPSGGTFLATRMRADAEFMASTDPWFHPVNTAVGPDGALYVVDFYRKLVEHPTFIARADSQGLYTYAGKISRDDFLEGQDRGRIYRVVSEEVESGSTPHMSTASAEALVAHLAHPNMWWRINAQRILVERRMPQAVPLLREAVTSSGSPEGRMHALWTLDGFEETLEPDLLSEVLADDDPRVRRQAVRVAEGYLEDRVVRKTLLGMTDDPNEQVQFQLVLSLGELATDPVREALQSVSLRHMDDRWFRLAALTSVSDGAMDWYRVVAAAGAGSSSEPDGKLALLEEIASIVGARQDAPEISSLLSAANVSRKEGSVRLVTATLTGLADGLDRGPDRMADVGVEGQRILVSMLGESSPDVREAAVDVSAGVAFDAGTGLAGLREAAAENALDETLSVRDRVIAAKVVGLESDDRSLVVLDSLLSPRQRPRLRLAAAEVLSRTRESRVDGIFTAHWEAYTAEVRAVVEQYFLSTTDRTEALLSALEEGRIEPSWISRTTRSRLMQSSDDDSRVRAEQIFAGLASETREEVVRRYHRAIQMQGSAAAGRQVFDQQCAACHRLGDTGYDVGPDLVSLTNRTKIDLLTQILAPNDNIAPGYETYIVETSDGRTMRGVLVNESSSTILLRSAGGTEQTVYRNNIRSMRPSDVSLMPAGLENSITVQEMADLLTYLRNLR